MSSRQKEVDILAKQYRKQTFWKYHCMKLSPMEFYLTTNPDWKHKYARSGPGYFVKLEKLDEGGYRFIFKQNSESNVKPFIVDKIDKVWRIRCQYVEYVDGLVVKNHLSNSNRDIALAFDHKGGKKSEDANGELVYFDDYNMQNLKVCCIKEKKSTMFGKGKYGGLKLAKDKSVYFMDTGFFKQKKWYDQVVAVWRPCNRNVKSKMKIKVMSVRKKKLEFTEDDTDDDSGYGEDYNDDDDGDENGNGDRNDENGENGGEYYEVKDGLFDRHPVDDSPNNFKEGWLTIYDKGRYFEKVPGGGNWEVVIGLTFALGIEKIIDRFV